MIVSHPSRHYPGLHYQSIRRLWILAHVNHPAEDFIECLSAAVDPVEGQTHVAQDGREMHQAVLFIFSHSSPRVERHEHLRVDVHSD